jgi:peptidoglycan/LPS O-acetylase OafA/YrhL
VIFGAALWRVPARIGALSYELYLLHPIVLALLAPLFVAWSLSFGAALALSVAVGGLVAHGVEVSFTRPMNRLIRRSLLRADNEPLVESARA